MGKKKHDRLLFFEVTKDGRLSWPGPPIDVTSFIGNTSPLKEVPANREFYLRLVFAVILDPTTYADGELRADQFALDLIEQLQPPCQISPLDDATVRMILMALPRAFQEDPDFETWPQLAAQNTARKLRKRLVGKSRSKPYLAPLLRVLKPIVEAKDDDEVVRAQLPIFCAPIPRPAGTRIDPTTIPLPLIRLYFMLVCMQRELENNGSHDHPRLKERDERPVCELAGEAVLLAKRATANAKVGEWRSVAEDVFQLGVACGSLAAQVNEYYILVGEERVAGGRQLNYDTSQEYRAGITDQERYIESLLSQDPPVPMGAIDERVSLRFQVAVSTAKRRRQVLRKKKENRLKDHRSE